MLLLCSVLNRQKKPLDGKSGGKEGRETTSAGGGGRREWLLDFMFQLYVDGRGTVSNQHRLVNDDVNEIQTNRLKFWAYLVMITARSRFGESAKPDQPYECNLK